ncbi:cyclin-D-binding Myb-like transcription factor 1 isoform X2 [Clupea harengus]|nr:cyclin-D-binding Myb-like transcription factor 1 isoform X2 [Clupea harengus]
MTATEMTEGELDQDGMAQIQILQDEDSLSPQKTDVSPVSQAWFTTKEDKDTLVNKGHKWKQGMWSKEEIDILMNNIDSYLKGRGIQDPTEIIFEMSKDERKDFYRSIAWGLNRPLFAVYRRVLRMYDNRNHVGKYTPEEIEKLKELRQKHGNDWATIGAALGRSASSVKDRCRLMKDTCNTGKWTEEEERRLAEVVHELTGTEVGEVVTQGVSWASVAELVGTRSEKQCRSKWLNYLNWKQSGGTEWTKEDDLNLVRRIAELGAEDENEIHWEKLAGGWRSVRSPQWLRSKWWTIKRQVANHKELPFPVLLKGLQDVAETQSYSKVLLVGSRAGSSSPPVTALQIPVQIPVQITHVSNDGGSASTEGETITLNQGALQTFELVPSFHLQPTGTPGTYYIQTTGTNQNLPLTLSANPTVTLTASASPTSPDQIILHSLTTDGLNENMSVQMAHPGVIIQTVTSDLCPSEPLEGEEPKEDGSGEGAEPSDKLQSSTEAEGTTEELTHALRAKTLDSPALETPAVDSGITEGAVLIVPSPNSFIPTSDNITDDISTESVLPLGTLTDPILQNQEEGSD